jgi:putative sterol carrier protein
MLSVAGRPSALPEGQTCELRIGDEVFYLGSDDGRATVRRGPAPDGDVMVTMSTDTLYRLMTGQVIVAEALECGTVDGEAGIAHLALEPVAGVGRVEHATAS